MLKSIFHIVLAVNFLTATMGITLDKHFCGGLLQKVSLLGDELSCCEMEKEMGGDCCHNEHETHQIEQEYQQAKFKLELPKAKLIDTAPLVHNSYLPSFCVTLARRYHSPIIYEPPLLTQDLSIAFQTFLI